MQRLRDQILRMQRDQELNTYDFAHLHVFRRSQELAVSSLTRCLPCMHSIMYGALMVPMDTKDGASGGALNMRIEIEQFSATMQMLKGLVFICDKGGLKLLDRQLRVCDLFSLCRS